MSLSSGSLLYVDGKRLKVVDNPFWANMPFVQEGRKSWIYQLSDELNIKKFALKVFKPMYLDASIANNFNQIKKYKSISGFTICDRYLITKQNEKKLVENFPELNNAILMPWIENHLWSTYLGQKMVLSRETCNLFAEQLTNTLVVLETNGHAHCDLASENIAVNSAKKAIEMLDIEDMYGKDFTKPKFIPMGGEGYQHRAGLQGTWNQFGDRFAGAILLSELLTWHFKEIREAAYGESFFSSKDMQDIKSPRYQLVIDKLGSLNSLLAELMERAWYSNDFEECPKLTEWHNAFKLYNKNIYSGDANNTLRELALTIDQGIRDLKSGQSVIYNRINSYQQSQLDLIVIALKNNQIEQNEIKQMVSSIRRYLKFINQNKQNMAVFQAAEQLVKSDIEASQKLELTLPIIPFILDYKVELSGKSAIEFDDIQKRVQRHWSKLLLLSSKE